MAAIRKHSVISFISVLRAPAMVQLCCTIYNKTLTENGCHHQRVFFFISGLKTLVTVQLF